MSTNKEFNKVGYEMTHDEFFDGLHDALGYRLFTALHKLPEGRKKEEIQIKLCTLHQVRVDNNDVIFFSGGNCADWEYIKLKIEEMTERLGFNRPRIGYICKYHKTEVRIHTSRK